MQKKLFSNKEDKKITKKMLGKKLKIKSDACVD